MKPILFNAGMVRAILNGSKTVTRRCAKFERRKEFPNVNLSASACEVDRYGKDAYCVYKRIGSYWNDMTYPLKPKYVIGDILYVRETWNQLALVNKYGYTHYDNSFYVYRADAEQPDLFDNDGKYIDDSERKWKPSIHMPMKAARIFLRVTDIHIERLQDIRYYEVYQEGIKSVDICNNYCKRKDTCANAQYLGKCRVVDCFECLWNSTIKKNDIDQYGWDANPYVFVYTFEVIGKDEAYENDV